MAAESEVTPGTRNGVMGVWMEGMHERRKRKDTKHDRTRVIA